MSASDYVVVSTEATAFFGQANGQEIIKTVGAIGYHETVWGTQGDGRDWICGMDDYTGGKQPQYQGFNNQIKETVAFLRNYFTLPVTEVNVYAFSRNYWKAGGNDNEAAWDAWAADVWAIYVSLVDDISSNWIVQAPQQAVSKGLWTNVPSLTNAADPSFMLALIAQTGINAVSLAKGSTSALVDSVMKEILPKAGHVGGKKPFTASIKDFLYAKYRKKGIIVPATIPGWLVEALIQMFGNDTLGNCVEAAQCNTEVAIALPISSSAATANFSTQTAINLYEVEGSYNPDNPNSDQGTVIRTALENWRVNGIVDDKGIIHKILAYLLLSGWEEMLEALSVFGFVIIGLELPESAIIQFNASQPWVVVQGVQIAGGHCVVLTSYIPPNLNCITWKVVQAMVQAFYETYCDEAWAVLTAEIVGPNGETPGNLDMAQLQIDLAALGGDNPPAPTATVVSIAITPATANIEVGQTVQMTATAAMSDNSTQDITATCNWESADQDAATVSAGLVTGVSAETLNVLAISGTVSGSAIITVAAMPASGTTIVLNVGTGDLTVTGGSNQATINGVQVPIDTDGNVIPFLDPKTGRTFIPDRFIAEALGCVVTWDEATKQVTIFRPAGDSGTPAVVSEYIEVFENPQ